MFVPINYQPVDLQQRAFSRMLLQFKNSPVLLSLLWAFISELQALSDAIADVINKRSPSEATGYNLEAIGRIVGQPRVMISHEATDWFVPDTDKQGADQGKAWVANAPETYNTPADDETMRMMIEAKVKKNFARYGSAPEIADMVLKAYNMRCSAITSGPGKIDIYIEDSASAATIAALGSYKTDNTVDTAYLIPVAAGVLINSVIPTPLV